MKKVIFKLIFTTILVNSFQVLASTKDPVGFIENKLDYEINYEELKAGNYQYFYCLLKQSNENGRFYFKNLISEQSETKVEEIVKTFLPLDTKKLWSPEDKNYLAVAKFNYILPINIKTINEEKFTGTKYLQSTLPLYKVTKLERHYHIGGSFITPDFNLYLNFINFEHPDANLIEGIDKQKMREGKIKISIMHQDTFGRVMFFRTAKMATAIIVYEEHTSNQTLVTQYILSNIINVPTKSLIRSGMIENLQNVVKGSREAVLNLNSL